MLLRKLIQLIALLLIITELHAQEPDPLIINSQEIKTDRYDNILGSPFLFEDDVFLDIISRNGALYKNLIGNYNGFDQGVEIYNGEKRIKLDKSQFTVIKFINSDSTLNDLMLIKGAHPKYPEKLIIQLFRGQKYSLLMEYHFRIKQQKLSNYGKQIVLKEFEFAPIYYLQIDNNWNKIKLTEKCILRKIDNRRKGNEILKKHSFHLNSESEVIQFLKKLESEIST
jgi:hypothetical protein